MKAPKLPPTLKLLIQKSELLTISTLRESGYADAVVSRMTREGKLERVGRGLYRHAESPVTENHEIKAVFAQTQQAIVVLISALRFHGIGTQVPHEVWIQIPASARMPALSWPPLRIIRTRLAAAITEGVNEHHLGDTRVRVTTPARTVADCFKHRSQIGLEACLEALREVLKKDRNIMPELTKHARMNRVLRVMQPYMEAMS